MSAEGTPGPPGDPRVRSVVVVGAGLAGARTVQALRAAGFAGRVTLLGAEGLEPYDRPPLSKELLSRPEPAWLRDELDVDLTGADVRLAEPATGLHHDADGITVRTAAGLHTADAAVLATGAGPVRPAGWDAALTLHTAATPPPCAPRWARDADWWWWGPGGSAPRSPAWQPPRAPRSPWSRPGPLPWPPRWAPASAP